MNYKLFFSIVILPISIISSELALNDTSIKIPVKDPTKALFLNETDLYSVSTAGLSQWDISSHEPSLKFFCPNARNKELGRTICYLNQGSVEIMDLCNGQWDIQKPIESLLRIIFRNKITSCATPLGEALTTGPAFRDPGYVYGLAYAYNRPSVGGSGIQFCGTHVSSFGEFIPFCPGESHDYCTSFSLNHHKNDYQLAASSTNGIVTMFDLSRSSSSGHYRPCDPGLKTPVLQTSYLAASVACLSKDASLAFFDPRDNQQIYKTLLQATREVTSAHLLPVPDGNRIFIAVNEQLSMFDMRNRSVQYLKMDAASCITALACSANHVGIGITLKNEHSEIQLFSYSAH